jgi:hypothetical protein
MCPTQERVVPGNTWIARHHNIVGGVSANGHLRFGNLKALPGKRAAQKGNRTWAEVLTLCERHGESVLFADWRFPWRESFPGLLKLLMLRLFGETWRI